MSGMKDDFNQQVEEARLIAAVRNGDVNTARSLIERHNFDVSAIRYVRPVLTGSRQYTLLNIAIEAKDLPMVRMLLDAGADPHEKSDSLDSPSGKKSDVMLATDCGVFDIAEAVNGAAIKFILKRASVSGDVSSARQMLKIMPQEEVNYMFRDGRTALMEACNYGYAETVSELLAHGADPNIANGIGNTAIHFCVGGKGTPEIVDMLANAGGNFLVKNWSGDPLTKLSASDEVRDAVRKYFDLQWKQVAQNAAALQRPIKVGKPIVIKPKGGQ